MICIEILGFVYWCGVFMYLGNIKHQNKCFVAVNYTRLFWVFALIKAVHLKKRIVYFICLLHYDTYRYIHTCGNVLNVSPIYVLDESRQASALCSTPTTPA